MHLLLPHGSHVFRVMFVLCAPADMYSMHWLMLSGTDRSSAHLMPIVSVYTWQFATDLAENPCC